MYKYFSFFLFAVSVIIVIVPACKKKNDEEKISKHNSSESRNMNGNCMNCHRQGGSGEGSFNIAGTVFANVAGTQKQPNGFVKLYTLPNGNGELKYTLEVDGLGNFYSTENIDFSAGLYPAIVHANGNVKYMPQTITSGSCNSCHGVSTQNLWIN
jgi:cytochrome c553